MRSYVPQGRRESSSRTSQRQVRGATFRTARGSLFSKGLSPPQVNPVLANADVVAAVVCSALQTADEEIRSGEPYPVGPDFIARPDIGQVLSAP
jgi:hypothetical protein